jgi:hypothetical protein
MSQTAVRCGKLSAGRIAHGSVHGLRPRKLPKPRLISESAPVRSRQFLLEPRHPPKSLPSVTLYEMATGVLPQSGDWIITRSLRVRATQCRPATSAASIAPLQACRSQIARTLGQKSCCNLSAALRSAKSNIAGSGREYFIK